MSTPFDNCFLCNKSIGEAFLRDINECDISLWTLFCKIFRVSPDESHLETYRRCRICFSCHSLALQSNEVYKKIELLQKELGDLSQKLKDVIRKTISSGGSQENVCLSQVESDDPLKSLRIFLSKNLNGQVQAADVIHVMPVLKEEVEQDDDADFQAHIQGVCNSSNGHYGNGDTNLERDAEPSCFSNEMRDEVEMQQSRGSLKNFRTFIVQGYVLKDLEVKLERLSQNRILDFLANRCVSSDSRNCGEGKSPDYQNSDDDDSWVGESSSEASSEDGQINLPAASLRHRKQESAVNRNVDEENLQCLVCTKVFSSRQYLRQHMKLHEGKNHGCEICESSFKTRAQLRHHKKRIHDRDKICAQCGKAFPFNYELKKHEITHLKGNQIRNSTCKPSDTTFASREAFLEHRKEKHIAGGDVDDENFQCPVCMKFFSSRLTLRRHMQLHGDKNHVCDICSRSFTSRAQLNRHVKRHNRDKICADCGKDFAFDYELKEHERIHRKEEQIRNLACEPCDTTFASREAFLEHRKEKHVADGDVDADDLQCPVCMKFFRARKNLRRHMELHEGKNHDCEICGSSFKTRRQFTVHMKKIHIRDKICAQCGKEFAFDYELKDHERIHQREDQIRNLTCEPCNLTFDSENDFLEHRKQNHSANGKVDDERLQCQVCMKFASSRDYLRRHMESHQEKTHTCEICGKSFKSRKQLNVHMKKTHIRDKMCAQCGKNFAFDYELKDHERIHQREDQIRNLTCEPCNLTFDSENDFLEHRKQNHSADGKVDDDGLQCLVCRKLFDCRTNLRKHMLKHSNEKPLCELCGKGVWDVHKHKTYCLEKLQTGEKNFRCSHCDQAFHLETSLKRHEDTHLNSNRFDCEVCQKKFQFKSLLTQHRRSHFPEEGIPCKMCSARFIRPQDLTWHMEYDHYGNRDKCSVCGYEAPTRKQFRRHELQHKFGRRFECNVCGKKFFKGQHMKRHRRIHEKSEKAMEANTDSENVSEEDESEPDASETE